VGPQGRFSFKKEKDKTPRYFRVRVMFKDDGLKLYPPPEGLLSKLTEAATGTSIVGDLAEDALEIALSQTTRLAYDVKWYDVIKDDDRSERRGPGTVDLGDIVFASGGRLDRSDRIARRHADIWWLAKKMMEVLEGIDCGFVAKRPVAIIHPFQSGLIGDGVESSYANPETEVAHLIENSRSDHFNAPSLAHEFMHLWAYQFSTGELGMAWQLLIHGSTHEGRQAKSWVAFHEAFAEWASNLIYSDIYRRPATIYGLQDERTGTTLDNRAVPFSRRFLRDQGIRSLSDLDQYELGWVALFTALVTKQLELHDPDTDETWADYPGLRAFSAGAVLDRHGNPALVDILRAFRAAPAKGYPKVISTKEMNRVAFLKRLMAVSPVITAERRDLVNELLNTGSKSSGPPRGKKRKTKPVSVPAV
jgi:hypothetical protein